MMRGTSRAAGLFWLTLLFPALAPAAEFTAQVVRVKDGDSLAVLHDNKQMLGEWRQQDKQRRTTEPPADSGPPPTAGDAKALRTRPR
jgi:hypothetical protein